MSFTQIFLRQISGRVVTGLVHYHHIFLLDFIFSQGKRGEIIVYDMLTIQFYILLKYA